MNTGDSDFGQEKHEAAIARSASMPRSNSTAIPEVIIGSHFKMIWLTITTLTIMLAFADILLSVLIQHPTATAQQAISMCDSFAKVGFGGIFGMIGAKALG
jgi:hypothetical protein